MSEIDELDGQQLRRQLNDQDDMDNLELQYDRQNEVFDYEKYSSDLLFAVQGLGSVKIVRGIEIYVKGPHCEESIKDLIRICRRDDPDDPLARRKLAGWKTFENDLIQLLLTQYQDQKLSFYLILLMVNLSEQPSQTCSSKPEIYEALCEYKLAFLKPQVVGTLIQHLGDCIGNHEEDRKKQQEQMTNQQIPKKGIKAHEQMMELIVILIKNVLAIKDYEYNESTHNEIRKNMHFHLLCQLRREHCFDLLIFLTHDFSKFDILKKLDLTFLEIFYHILGRFDPEWLCGGQVQSELQELIQKDRLQRKKMESLIPTRHTRFQADFRFKRMLDNTKQITTNPFPEQGVIHKDSKKQLKKAIQRKVLKSMKGIFGQRLHLDMKVEIPLEQPIQSEIEGEELIKTELISFKTMMCQFAIEFVRYCFGPLFDQCYNVLYAQNERLEPSDVIYYFVLLGFGLKMARVGVFENKSADLKVEDVAAGIQLTQFQLIFAYLTKEVTQRKKKSFNLTNFYGIVYAFHELLLMIKSMSLDTSQSNRKNAQIMIQNIFHHDVTKAIRCGLDHCQKGALNNEILKIVVELISVFFDMLESYSKGKVLTLQTEKLVKKNNKAKQAKKANKKQLQEELNEFIEKVPGEEGENDEDFDPAKELEIEKEPKEKRDWEKDNDGEYDDDDDDDDDDGPRFQERKYNLKSEFAILAEYAVIEKVLWLIEGDKILENSSHLNNAVYKFIQRTTDLLQAEWLFYQIDFLSTFQGILSNQEIRMRIEMRKFVDLFKKILKKMFEKLKENKLLVVEMLFRFTDFQLKNSILCNYEDLNKKQEEDNDFVDENNEEQQQFIQERKVWIEQEDRAIINNYDTFKELPNVYEQLVLVLNGLGYYDKSPLDVRRRIKYLKVHKGKKRAELMFKEIYGGKKESVKSALLKLRNKLKQLLEQKQEGAEEKQKTIVEFKDVLLFVETLFINFKEYLLAIETDQGSIDSELDRILLIQDFAIVPFSPKDFDILALSESQGVLESLGMKRPIQGQAFWRVPGYFKVSDIDLLKDKLEEALANLDNNDNGQEEDEEVNYADDNEKEQNESQNNDFEENGEMQNEQNGSEQKSSSKKKKKKIMKERIKQEMKYESAFVQDYEGDEGAEGEERAEDGVEIEQEEEDEDEVNKQYKQKGNNNVDEIFYEDGDDEGEEDDILQFLKQQKAEKEETQQKEILEEEDQNQLIEEYQEQQEANDLIENANNAESHDAKRQKRKVIADSDNEED